MFTTPPIFYDGQMISAIDHLRVTRTNVAALDAMSFRAVAALDNAASSGYNIPVAPTGYDMDGKPNKASPPFRTWKGCFRFRSGMTTLTVAGRTDAPSGVTLKIYVNGPLAATISAPTSGFTQTISLSGLTDGQIVPVEVQTGGSGNTSDASFVITRCEASPISKSGWPGVPTFTTATINAAKLNQLSSACQWLYDRMNLAPMVPGRGITQMIGALRQEHRPIWSGSITKGYANDILWLNGRFTNFNETMRYDIYLNGSAAAVGVSQPIGTYDIAVPISLASIATGATAEVLVVSEGLDSIPRGNYVFSRWSLWSIMTLPDGSGYGYATLPADFAYGSLAPSTLVSRLNSLCTILSTVKSRIDAAPHIFGVGRAFRWPYGYDDRDGMANLRGPARFIRRGNKLVVKGKDVKLSWGAPTFPTRDDGAILYDQYTFPYNEPLIDGDKVDTKEIFLDTYPVQHGQLAYLTGTVYYAEELYS